VGCKVSTLFFNGFLDWNAVDNIFLRSVLDTNITKSEGDLLVHDHALGVCATIHDINLSYDTDCTDTFLVKLTRHLKAIGSCHICICGHDAKNNCAGVTYVSVGHSTSNFFDIVWLARDGNTGDTGKINQCKIGAGVGVNLEHDWLVNNIFVVSANFVSEADDVVLHLLKVCEFSSRNFIGENCIRGGISMYMVET